MPTAPYDGLDPREGLGFGPPIANQVPANRSGGILGRWKNRGLSDSWVPFTSQLQSCERLGCDGKLVLNAGLLVVRPPPDPTSFKVHI